MSLDLESYSPEEIRSYVYERMDVLRDEDRTGNIHCICPRCGTEEIKFSVNVYKGVFNCWRGTCKFSGKSLTPLFAIYGPIHRDYKYDESFSRKGKDSLEQALDSLDPSVYFHIWDNYCEPIQEISPRVLEYHAWKSFFDSRHIPLEDLYRIGVRYAANPLPSDLESVYGRFRGYFVFPYMTPSFVPEFFQCRIQPNFASTTSVKWKFPKVCKNFSRDRFLFRSDPFENHPDVYICESLLDSIRLGRPGVSIGGSSISEHQLKVLSSWSPKRVFLILDGDAAGEKASFRIAKFLQKYGFFEVLVPPKSYFSSGKDPDELSDSEVHSFLSSFSEFHEKLWLF